MDQLLVAWLTGKVQTREIVSDKSRKIVAVAAASVAGR
jgi:hypothetical protein